MWVVCQWSLTRGYADIFATAIIIVKIYVFFYTANILKKIFLQTNYGKICRHFCDRKYYRYYDVFCNAYISAYIHAKKFAENQEVM